MARVDLFLASCLFVSLLVWIRAGPDVICPLFWWKSVFVFYLPSHSTFLDPSVPGTRLEWWRIQNFWKTRFLIKLHQLDTNLSRPLQSHILFLRPCILIVKFTVVQLFNVQCPLVQGEGLRLQKWRGKIWAGNQAFVVHDLFTNRFVCKYLTKQLVRYS